MTEGWIDLLIRFWLAQAFLAGAVADLMANKAPAMAGPGALAGFLNPVVASPAGVLVQTLCPVLLLLGLGTRVAAVPLLIQALLLSDAETPAILRHFWTALLGWMVVMGPGAFSIDALLGRGLDSSAIPGARRVAALFAAVTRYGGPVYQLLVRLWIATAPLAAAAAAFGWMTPVALQPVSPWLAAVPDRVAATPPALLLAAGLLLALGLATRACALGLLVAIPVAQVGMTFDTRLYWALLLGLLLTRGPGPIALDRLLDAALRKLDRRTDAPVATLPHVVIVGGGFGGVSAARALDGAPCRVTLVDQRNHHLFQPLLYQVATAGLSPAAIATPIRSLFRVQDNVRVLLAEVTGVARDAGEVVLDGGRLAYDYLILATGAEHSYFGRDDWAAAAPGLKRIEDATEIRRRLLTGFERAENAADPAERAGWLTFVIVGGGPTGVELAGAVAELARNGLTLEYRAIDPADARVILVQSAPRLLPTFPDSLSTDATAELKRLGVEVRTGAKVEQIDRDGVVVSGERIAARTVLWAAGVAASPAGRWLEAPTDKAGRTVVGPDLTVAPHANVFVIGDAAASKGWNGQAVPGLAPAAKQGGAYAAKVIRARLKHRPPPKPFRYRHAGSLATVGRRAAVAEFGWLRVRGAPAWWLWGVVHIIFLAGGRNRASVILEWAWAYLTFRRGSRLITDER